MTVDEIGTAFGIFSSMPAEEYHAIDAASNSRLTRLLTHCPAKLRHELENPPPRTESLVIGSAVHCAVLEPETFLRRYARAPKVDRRTNVGKETWAAFVAANGDRDILDADQWDLVNAMAEAVRDNTHAAPALAAAPEREVSMFWTDGATGLRCKGRIDALGRGAGLIVDLKTTDNAGREFERSIDAYGYARQAAFYLHGAAACGVSVGDFLIVAVEKSPPYLVGLHRISEVAIEAAAKELRPLIGTYHQCQTSNAWPGYEPRDADLPAWAHKRIAAANAAKE